MPQRNYIVARDRTAMWAFSEFSTVDDVMSVVAANWKKSRGSFVLLFKGHVMGPGGCTLQSLGVLNYMALEVAEVERRLSL